MSPDLHHLSGAYAVDALDAAERTSFEQHLAVCADCRAEVSELSATAHALGSLTETAPPPELHWHRQVSMMLREGARDAGKPRGRTAWRGRCARGWKPSN